MALVVTPDAIASFQREVHVAILGLNDDIAAERERLAEVSPRFLSQWRRFRDAWSAYYRDNSSFFARTWGATMDAAERFAEALSDWRASFIELTGTTPTAPVVSASSTPSARQIHRTFDLASRGLVIGGGIMALYFLSKFVK